MFRRLGVVLNVRKGSGSAEKWTSVSPWPLDRQGLVFDADDAEHMKWVFERAVVRATQYGIPGRGLHSSTFRLNVSTFSGIRWVHDFPPVY